MGNPRSRRRLGGLPAARVATIPLTGGVDTETPTAQARPGTLAAAVNYEVGIRGGYQDIQGYRRIDGLKGTGPIIGLFVLKGILYAINSSASTRGRALVQWLDESDPENPQWVELKSFHRINFTSGGGIPALVKGMTLQNLQGDFQFEVLFARVESGSFDDDDAAGYIITDSDPTGHFSNLENIYHDSPLLTQGIGLFAGASEITLQDGATYEFSHGGFAATDQVFMVNGIGQCVEFDGDVMVPIDTGHPNDTPGHVAVHESRLWLSFGSSVMFSAAGNQYDWSGALGAAEINTGSVITALHVEPGQEGKGSLAAFSDDIIHIIQGAIDSLNTQSTGQAGQLSVANYRREIGAHPFSVQEMASTIFTDDWGVRELKTAQEFGNFSHSTLTEQMQTLWRSMLRGRSVTASTISRRKNQYRVFLDDGSGIYVSFHGRRLTGCMPIKYPHVVNCATSDEFPDGRERIFIGTLNRETNRPDDSVDYGSVMECDIPEATSFDGDPICAYFVTNFNPLGSRGTWKGFKDLRLETEVSGVSEFLMGFSAGYGDSSGHVDIQSNVPIMEDAARSIGASRAFNIENFMLNSDSDGLVFGVGRNSAIDPPVQFNSADVRFTMRRVKMAQGYVIDPSRIAENLGERISCDMGDDLPGDMAINSVAPVGTASLLVKYGYKGDLVDDRVKAYYVRYRHEEESTWRTSGRIPVGTDEYRTPKVRSGRYEFQASAVNPSGPGPWSPSKYGSVAESGMYVAEGAAGLVPNKPTGLANSDIMNVQFKGSWAAPVVDEQHAAAESYNVRIRLFGTGDYGDPIPVDGLEHVFDMLRRDTDYEWQAQGVNEHGEGEWSDGLGVKTTNLLVPGVPTGLGETASMATSGTAFAEFVAGYTAPAVDADHGAADTYNIAYKRQTESRPTVITGVTALSHRLHTLKPSTVHEWRVQAVNSAGPGEWSDWREHTTAAQALLPPGVPTNLMNTGISYNTWEGEFDAPAVDAMHGAAERYGGEWRKVDDAEWNPEVESIVDQITFTVPDDDEDYEWRVRAFNGAGASEFSAPIRVKTLRLPMAPNPPTLGAATGISAMAATIGWTASVVDDTHDAAEYYQAWVYNRTPEGNFGTFIANYTVRTGTSVEVSNLQAESPYIVWLLAVNDGGFSSGHIVIFDTTAAGTGNVPNPPTGLVEIPLMRFGYSATIIPDNSRDRVLNFAFKPSVVDADNAAADRYVGTLYAGSIADNMPDSSGAISASAAPGGNIPPQPLLMLYVREKTERFSTIFARYANAVRLSSAYAMGRVTGNYTFGDFELELKGRNSSGDSAGSSGLSIRRYGDNAPPNATLIAEDASGIGFMFTPTAGDPDASNGFTSDFSFQSRSRESAVSSYGAWNDHTTQSGMTSRFIPFLPSYVDTSGTPFVIRGRKRRFFLSAFELHRQQQVRVRAWNTDPATSRARSSAAWSAPVSVNLVLPPSADPGYLAPAAVRVLDVSALYDTTHRHRTRRFERGRIVALEWDDSSNKTGWVIYVHRFRVRGGVWDMVSPFRDVLRNDFFAYLTSASEADKREVRRNVFIGERNTTSVNSILFEADWFKSTTGGKQTSLIYLPASSSASVVYEIQIGVVGFSISEQLSSDYISSYRTPVLTPHIRWSPVLTHTVQMVTG